ncbi:AAA family ATPase [Candidatus Saccharibacteria bacterium]|nr:AAA family ATPase [Candidatus Saccharibacteria bacterium]
MKVTRLVIDNFKAFDHIELNEDFFASGKYLLVGKNGSGKTTILEALRLCLAAGQESNQPSPYLYGCVRDKQKRAALEAHIELDDEELKICSTYLSELTEQGGPAWNSDERDKYDLSIGKSIICKIGIDVPIPGGGQNPTGNMTRTQAYISAPTLELLANGEYQPPKYHMIAKLFTQNQNNRPLVYISPFRTVQFQDTMLFQNYGATVQNQTMPGMNGSVNDPIRSVNYSQPDFGKNLFQFSYAAELYSGILGEFYEIAKENKQIREKIRSRIAKDMVHINEMLNPKCIDDVVIDLSSNTLTYRVSGPDGTYTINGLSAGEEQLVIFGLSLHKYLNVGADSIKPVVIIDEPELHLHPEYCSRLGKFLSESLPTNDSQQLFIASHSVEIIQQLSDIVYQITAADIKKIEDVMERTELFHALGANFSVADIVNKIVFVEGELGSTVQLDGLFYQKLSNDPHSKQVRFIEVGNKKNVARVQLKSKEWIEFIHHEIDSNNSRDVFAIVDGDVLGWVEGNTNSDDKLLVLPCYSVENLLLQPDIIARAYPGISSPDITNAFNKIKDQVVTFTADQVIKEYISQHRRSFVVDGKKSQVLIEAGFDAHLKAYYKALEDLPSSYRAKVAEIGDNWYLFVVGKQLRIDLCRELMIKDSKRVMFSKLIQSAQLDDMPQTFQAWFNKHITS